MHNKTEITTDFAEEALQLKGKNMLAVISGHRGCGKTWFSLNLAHAFSLFKQKVMLFDGDCGLNNTKIQLGLDFANDLDAVIYGNRTLNQVIFNYEKGRFDIAVGNSGSSGLSTMSIGRLQILGEDLNIISQNYDKMILDLSSGITNPTKVLAGMSQSAIIICNDDPQSITNNYELIRLMTTRFPNTSLSIVVNQVNYIEDGLRTYKMLQKACSDFLKSVPPLRGIIRQDTRVRDSIRNQSTIISRYPESEAALDIIAVAQRILKNECLSWNRYK